MTLRVAVVGASGRAGSELIKALDAFPEIELTAALVSANSSALGNVCRSAPLNNGREVKFTSELEVGIRGAQGVIEFSSAAVSVEVARLCATIGRPLILASSGHSAAQLAEVREASQRCAILQASNLSIGVFALHEICKLSQSILGDAFQIEISEIHHRHKKDAPSGTALSLARALQKEGELSLVPDRGVRIGARGDREIGIASLRADEVFGEHTVYFFGPGERLELTHRTASRAVFGQGALRLFGKLLERGPGLYGIKDLI